MKNKTQKQILATIGANKDKLYKLIYSFDPTVNDSNLLEKILYNINSNDKFAYTFALMMDNNYKNAEGLGVKGWTSIIGSVGTAAGGLLGGLYDHKDTQQANDFQAQLALLKAQSDEKNKQTMLIFGGIGAFLLIGGIILYVIKNKK